MIPRKEYPSDKLQKSSILFLQLGLVLALFIVYGVLEFETEKKPFNFVKNESSVPDIIIESVPTVIIDRNKKIKTKRKLKKQIFKEVFKTKPDNKIVETIIDPETPDSSDINQRIDNLPGGETLDSEPDEIIDFKILEDAPIFAGCEGLKKEESKKCFSKKISNFINRQFNTEVANDLSGKQKIWVEFKVDKNGEIVDIKARSPHKRLEKEAIRVIEKLPSMTPGMQRNRPVSVKYTLPIVFQLF